MGDDLNEDVLLGGDYSCDDNLLDYDEDNILSDNFDNGNGAIGNQAVTTNISGGDLRASLSLSRTLQNDLVVTSTGEENIFNDNDEDEPHHGEDLLLSRGVEEEDLVEIDNKRRESLSGPVETGARGDDLSPSRERVGRFEAEREDVRAQLSYHEDVRSQLRGGGRGGRDGTFEHRGRGGKFFRGGRGGFFPSPYFNGPQRGGFARSGRNAPNLPQFQQPGLTFQQPQGVIGMPPQPDHQQLLLANSLRMAGIQPPMFNLEQHSRPIFMPVIHQPQPPPQLIQQTQRPSLIQQPQPAPQTVPVRPVMDAHQQQAELLQILLLERERQLAIDREHQEQQNSLLLQRQQEFAQQQAQTFFATQVLLQQTQQQRAFLTAEEEKLRKQQDAFLASLAAKPIRNMVVSPPVAQIQPQQFQQPTYPQVQSQPVQQNRSPQPQKVHPQRVQVQQGQQPQPISALSGEPRRKILLNPQFQQKMAQQMASGMEYAEAAAPVVTPASNRRIVLAPSKRDSSALAPVANASVPALVLDEVSPAKIAKPAEKAPVQKPQAQKTIVVPIKPVSQPQVNQVPLEKNNVEKSKKPAENSYESEYERAEREREVARTRVRVKREASRFQMNPEQVAEIEKMVFEQGVDVSAACQAVKQGLRAPTRPKLQQPQQSEQTAPSGTANVTKSVSAVPSTRRTSVLIENVSSATPNDKIARWCSNVGEVLSFTRKSSNSVLVKFRDTRSAAEMAAKFSRW